MIQEITTTEQVHEFDQYIEVQLVFENVKTEVLNKLYGIDIGVMCNTVC